MTKKEIERLKEDYAALADLYLNDRPSWSELYAQMRPSSSRFGVEETDTEYRWAKYRWMTANGASVSLSQEDGEVDDGHLRNIVFYCLRRIIGGATGSGATRYIQDLDRWIEGLHYSLREARRRGLDV